MKNSIKISQENEYCLSNVRRQVVWNAIGILADQTTAIPAGLEQKKVTWKSNVKTWNALQWG
jgi:hypothetical protein